MPTAGRSLDVSLHRRGALSLVATLLGAGCLGVDGDAGVAVVLADAETADAEQRCHKREGTASMEGHI